VLTDGTHGKYYPAMDNKTKVRIARSVLHIRMPANEIEILKKAAKTLSLRLSPYVRTTMLTHARRRLGAK
jgi:hypothetical protein